MSCKPFLRFLALCAVLGSFMSCGATVESFVRDKAGYSVTKGRLVRVDRLTSETITTFSDGVAFVVDSSDCKVSMEFADGSQQVIELRHPSMIVMGAEAQYVLQPAADSPTMIIRK